MRSYTCEVDTTPWAENPWSGDSVRCASTPCAGNAALGLRVAYLVDPSAVPWYVAAARDRKRTENPPRGTRSIGPPGIPLSSRQPLWDAPVRCARRLLAVARAAASAAARRISRFSALAEGGLMVPDITNVSMLYSGPLVLFWTSSVRFLRQFHASDFPPFALVN